MAKTVDSFHPDNIVGLPETIERKGNFMEGLLGALQGPESIRQYPVAKPWERDVVRYVVLTM